MALSFSPEPRKAKPEKKVRKPGNRKFTEEKVLEIRAKHQFGGVACKALAEEYGTSVDYMRLLLAYNTYAHLVPRKP